MGQMRTGRKISQPAQRPVMQKFGVFSAVGLNNSKNNDECIWPPPREIMPTSAFPISGLSTARRVEYFSCIKTCWIKTKQINSHIDIDIICKHRFSHENHRSYWWIYAWSYLAHLRILLPKLGIRMNIICKNMHMNLWFETNLSCIPK